MCSPASPHTEGHPDTICDAISDPILDAMLTQDPHRPVAVETMLTTGLMHVAGEVTATSDGPIADIARRRILHIGYDFCATGFDTAYTIYRWISEARDTMDHETQSPTPRSRAPARV